MENKTVENILIELTEITGFDHTDLANSAFSVAKSKIKQVIQEAIAEERDRISGEIIGEKKYWHLQFEDCSDYAESIKRKEHNEDFTNCINRILDQLNKRVIK